MKIIEIERMRIELEDGDQIAERQATMDSFLGTEIASTIADHP